jgi:hypothetical protein
MTALDKADHPVPEGVPPMPPISILSRIALLLLVVSAVVRIAMYAAG